MPHPKVEAGLPEGRKGQRGRGVSRWANWGGGMVGVRELAGWGEGRPVQMTLEKRGWEMAAAGGPRGVMGSGWIED